MAILQVRDIDERLYLNLKLTALKENRSISQEVIVILEKYLQNPENFNVNPTREFLNLSSAWSDSRTADEIKSDFKKNRKNKKDFGVLDGIVTKMKSISAK